MVGRSATGILSCGLSRVFFGPWGKYDFIGLAVCEALTPGRTGAHKAGYTAEYSVLPQSEQSKHRRPGLLPHNGGDGSQAQSTCSTDEVYPFGYIRTQCGKKGATVWGQEAPEQLTPMFSQPCPQHTLAEGLSVSGYDLVTHFPSFPQPLAACLLAHQNHLGLDLPHPNNTLARRLPPGRGRPLGGWPRGPGKEHKLLRSTLRYPSPRDRRTRQAGALTTFREQGEESHVTYPSLPVIPTNALMRSVSARVTGQNCPDPSLYFIPLTLPIIPLPKPRASPRMQDKLRRNRRTGKYRPHTSTVHTVLTVHSPGQQPS